jgi:DNA invertase Pin-like site-specific DNA recombinase
MKVGYARVSKPALQTDALRRAGCKTIFTDKGVSGAAIKRPQLDRCLKQLQRDDVLVVWKLDRLGRSLAHLLELADELRSRGIGFASLSEHIDTTTPQGTLVFHLMGALAQFERSLIAEDDVTYFSHISGRWPRSGSMEVAKHPRTRPLRGHHCQWQS